MAWLMGNNSSLRKIHIYHGIYKYLFYIQEECLHMPLLKEKNLTLILLTWRIG